jgi:transcriptional regulator with XRE-family HTH domain
VFVTHPPYIREKARQMRVEKDLTIDEISERLGISRQTIFYWVKDVPLKKPRRRPDYRARAVTNSLRYKALRDEAYEEGWAAFDELILEPTRIRTPTRSAASGATCSGSIRLRYGSSASRTATS